MCLCVFKIQWEDTEQWLVYKQLKLLAHSSGGFEIQTPRDLVFSGDPSSREVCSIYDHRVEEASKPAQTSSVTGFYKRLIPLMRMKPP